MTPQELAWVDELVRQWVPKVDDVTTLETWGHLLLERLQALGGGSHAIDPAMLHSTEFRLGGNVFMASDVAYSVEVNGLRTIQLTLKERFPTQSSYKERKR